MTDKNIQETSEIQRLFKKTMFWLNLTSIQAFLFIFWLLIIPKEAGNAIIFGFSLKRLALLIPLLLPAIGAILLKWKLEKNPDRQYWFSDARKKSQFAAILTASGFLIAVIMVSTGFLYHFLAIPVDINIYIRLLPVITCYFLLGVEAVIFVPLILYPTNHTHQKLNNSFPWLPFCISFGILVLGLLIVTLTGLGINPVRVSIISLGSPLLEGQIWYVMILLALLLIAAYAWKCIPEGSRPVFHGNVDLTIALILWLLAVVLWMSLPLPKNNYFAPQVQAPNFEKYPFSDAEQYDFNSLYVFYGTLKDFVISKPLYVSLLALFHAIAGLSYDRVIFLQTLLVALFPSVLYLIGKELHSRMGGIAIALFAIMREVTAIQATTIANVSSTKLLLSDMPATLLASVLSLMLIRWFKSNEKKINGHEFIIGGLVGMFILMRIQTMALIPFILLLAVIRYFRNFKTIFLSVLIFIIGIGLVLTPILLRNHAITGVYWVDNPSSTTGLYTYFVDKNEVGLEIPEAKTQNQILQRNINMISFALINNISGIISFTADNFIRNEISSVLILPIRLGNNIQLIEYLKITNPFWSEVYSNPNTQNLIIFLLNFLIISIGFAKVFRKNELASLSVLGLHLIYSLSSAAVRLSGWRFILPMDWLFYAFFALGFVDLLVWFFRKITNWNLLFILPRSTEFPSIKQVPTRRVSIYATFGFLFIFIGAAIPMREIFLPKLIPEISKTEACQIIKAQVIRSENQTFMEGFHEYCLSENSIVLFGYGIYPRFFDAGEGYYDRSNDPWFGRQPFARLVFRLIGNQNAKIYIKSKNPAPRFPNGALMYVVGSKDPKIGAYVVLINGSQPELIISSEFLSGRNSFLALLK